MILYEIQVPGLLAPTVRAITSMTRTSVDLNNPARLQTSAAFEI